MKQHNFVPRYNITVDTSGGKYALHMLITIYANIATR